jgi:hypothetical protein
MLEGDMYQQGLPYVCVRVVLGVKRVGDRIQEMQKSCRKELGVAAAR